MSVRAWVALGLGTALGPALGMGCALEAGQMRHTPVVSLHNVSAAFYGETASIQGIVRHAETGEPIADALVILQCKSLQAPLESRTDARGIYRFLEIPAGQCTLQVLSGKADVSKMIKLAAGAKLRVNHKITPENQFVRAVVVAGPHRRTKKKSNKTKKSKQNTTVLHVDMEQAKSLPVGNTGRDFTSVVDLAPSASRTSAGVRVSGLGTAVPVPAKAAAAPVSRRAVRAPGAGRWDREGYAHTHENDVNFVRDAPLSTFSIDVDTASYTNTRRFLTSGQLPPPSSVRVEEMINYFHYEAGTPGDVDSPFSVQAEVGPSPWNPNHRLVRVTMKAREIPQTRVSPRNLTFLVDVSGSMASQDKLPLLRDSMRMLVDELRPQDTLAIVTYAGHVGVALPPTSGENRRSMLRAIDSLGSGGSTNGAGGIRRAYDLARASYDPRGINRVILGTDGDFNVGISSIGELTKLIEHERESGVFLTVLGFGTGNLQDATMESLADHGNGNYAYIDNEREGERVLVREASGTLVTVAKDVKLQVEFNPARVESYRLIGYANRRLADRDFDDDAKDAGEIGAGHTVTALYEIAPQRTTKASSKAKGPKKLRYQGDRQPTSASSSDELMLVNVRHKAPQGSRSRLQRWTVRDHGKTLSATSDDFRFAAAVAGFGMLLSESSYTSRLTWPMVESLAHNALARRPDAERTEFLSLVKSARHLASAGSRRGDDW